jgi:hypothetical protein
MRRGAVTLPVRESSSIMRLLNVVLLAAAVVLPQSLTAQRPPWLKEPYLKPAVYGRITDSASGRPIPGVRMQVDSMIGIPGSDKEGWYLLFGQRPGARHVSLYCPSQRRINWRKVAERVVDVGPRTDSLVNFQITLTGCNEPPSHTWAGEFRGHYTFGFESSDFTPCDPKLERLDGTAYEEEKQWVWVEAFAPDATKGIEWPKQNDPYYPKYYVRWRATVTGPGSYGHMGVGMYQMRVERVLEVREPRADDCN